MGERKEKKPIKRICAGLLAHVFARNPNEQRVPSAPSATMGGYEPSCKKPVLGSLSTA